MSTTKTIAALDECELPTLKGKDLLSFKQAIELVVVRSGLIIIPNHKISLPFTVERYNRKFVLRSHIPAFNTEIIEYLASENEVEVLFDTSGYYIDPALIKRKTPHAPTEVKAVFSIFGKGNVLNLSQHEFIKHLDQVRACKQAVYLPDSTFKVHDLPEDYLAENLAAIRAFEISIDVLQTHQLMALKHLELENREYIMRHLHDNGGFQALEAAKIINFFVGN